MEIGTKLTLIGILSLLVGSAFASPLLITELDIVPFWTVPEGPKADFNISVVYANFTIQENASNHVVAGYNMSVLDYCVVLNVTNDSNLHATVSELNFAAAKEITIIPSALGGFFGTHEGGMHSNNFGPVEGYAGHVGAGRVEGIWLDGEWVNVTWVPEGGLNGVWKSEDVFPPEGLEDIWESDVYPPTNVVSGNNKAIPFTSYGGSRSNDTTYYTYSGTIFNFEGGNYWIEGVPLKEYIVNNEVKATIIYYNGSWVDVTNRIEIKERPYVSAANTLLRIQTYFRRIETQESGYSGMIHTVSDHDASHTWLPSGFNNTWAPHQSRLIMLTGTVGIDSWKESFNEKAITLYTGSTNNLNNQIVDETYVNTYSSATELKTVQLKIAENEYYIYNTILADDQIFVTDSFGIEVFVEPRN